MALYYNDFRALADWSEQWDTGDSDWSVDNVISGSIASRYLKHEWTGGSSDDRAFAWNFIGTQDDVEVLAKVRTSDKTGYQNHIHVRGKGSSSNKSSYYVALYRVSGQDYLVFEQWHENSWFDIEAETISYSADEWMWIRFRAVGNEFKAKVWADGDPEPETWLIEYTDNTGTYDGDAGWVGFGAYENAGERYFDVIAVDDEANTIPLERPMEEFEDSFPGSSLDTDKWLQGEGSGGIITVDDGLTISVPDNETEPGAAIYTSNPYDFDDSHVVFNIDELDIKDGQSLALAVMSLYEENYQIFAEIKNVSGDLFISADMFSPTAFDSVGLTAYNPSLHKYIRIGESSGSYIIETSPDNETWTELLSSSHSDTSIPPLYSYISFMDGADSDDSTAGSITLAGVNVASPGYSVFDNDYRYARKITVDHDQVSGITDFDEFVVYVGLEEEYLRSVANDGKVEFNGSLDIRFEDTSGNKLDYEIEHYDATSGKLSAWVKVPTLHAVKDTEIYMYYGKSSWPLYEGITYGVAETDIRFFPNLWGGSSNTGELGLEISTLEGYGGSKTIGSLNNGVALAESLGSHVDGFLMYSEESVHTRFSSNPPNANNADHFIGVIYEDGQWKYDDNSDNFRNFTPRSSDILIASGRWGSGDIQWFTPIIHGTSIGDTWKSNWRVVYHMNNEPDIDTGTSEHRDSSRLLNHGSSMGAMTAADVVDGKLGKGLEFDGGGDRIDLGDKSDLEGVAGFHLSAWIYVHDMSGDNDIYVKSDHNSGEPIVVWADAGNDVIAFLVTNSDNDTTGIIYGNTTINENTWYHVAIVQGSGNEYRLYVNGVLDSSSTHAAVTGIGNGGNVFLGGDVDGSFTFNGIIDEFRFGDWGNNSSTPSGDFIATEYANQNNPATFYSVGEEELPEWKYRNKITIPASEIDSDLADFPIYVNLKGLGESFFSHVQPDGDDIRIMASDGETQLPHELVVLITEDRLNISPSGDYHGGGYGTVYKIGDDIHLDTMVIDADQTGELTIEFIPMSAPGEDISSTSPYLTKVVDITSTGRQTVLIDEDIPAGFYWVGQDGFSLMRTDPDTSADSDNLQVLYMTSQNRTGATNPRTYYFFDWKFSINPGYGELWFKADLSSSVDNEFYIYYGMPAAENDENLESLWADYRAVWHLGENPSSSAPQFKDSSPIGVHATNMGTDITTDIGIMGNAVNLFGDPDYIHVHPSGVEGSGNKGPLGQHTAITISAWVVHSSGEPLVAWGAIGGAGSKYHFRLDSGRPRTEVEGGYRRAATSISDGAPHLVHSVLDGNNVTDVDHYVDGVHGGSSGSSSQSIDIQEGRDIWIGRRETTTDSFDYFTGGFEEVRIALVVRSADWVAAEYANQSNPSGFYTLGDREDAIKATIELTTNTDAVLRKPIEVDTDTDAVIRITDEVTTDTDALLRIQQAIETGTDAVIRGSFTLATGTDALLRSEHSLEADTDALLRGAYSKTVQTDAVIIGGGALLTFTDAVLRDSHTVSTDTDAVLYLTFELTAETDAVLRKPITVDVDTDAVLRATDSITADTDAVIRKTDVLTASTDARLRSKQTFNVSVETDAQLKTGGARTVFTDAVLYQVHSIEVTTDAALYVRVGLAVTTDAKLDYHCKPPVSFTDTDKETTDYDESDTPATVYIRPSKESTPYTLEEKPSTTYEDEDKNVTPYGKC